jgi:hypothetical protein
MPRYSPKNRVPNRAARKRSKSGPAVATALAILAVLGIGYAVVRTQSPDKSASVPAGPVVASVDSAPNVADLQKPAALPVAPTAATQKPQTHNVAARPVASQPATQIQSIDSPESRAKRLRTQLDAGEFGPALATAREASDATEKSQLLQTVAGAQAQIGDFHAADRSISRIPVPEARDQARTTNSVKQSAAGGGANPTQLIALIKATTGSEDEWQDDDGRKQPHYWPPGIEVDPNGLMRGLTRETKDQALTGVGRRAREADLNVNMRTPSPLRLVSLTRLEKEIAKCLAEGRSVPETMQLLAGLTQIRYVFVYLDQNDVVIGGPAEGWKYNDKGLAVGRESNRPTLLLDDFVTVLRTFSPRGEGYFNCQIVPREEGLRKIKQFVEESNSRGPLEPGAVRAWTSQLQQQLGLQDVEIHGIPDDSRVAQVIFEADYRLKMIGIGKLKAVAGVPSYFDLLPKTGEVKSQKMDALRWWLSMKYDAVLHSPDRDVFEIKGAAVLCQSENEKISAKGQRIHTGQSEVTNRLFAANFTQHYPELAAADPVFADLQNIFDLSLVAALLTDNRVPERLGWDLGVFGVSGQYHTAHYQAPKALMSVVNHRVYNGKDIVVQVAGGVDGQLHRVLEDSKVSREVTALAGRQASGRAPQLPEGRWWWDAKSH